MQADNATGTEETRSLDGVKGTAQTSIAQTTDATTAARDGYHARFTSKPLKAQTIIRDEGAPLWVLALAVSESNANSNAFPNFGSVYIWRPSTQAVIGYLFDGFAAVDGEFPTTETGLVRNLGHNLEITIQDGDVLVLEIWRNQSQGMAVAYTNTLFFDGTTDPVHGTATTDAASYLQAPVDIPEITLLPIDIIKAVIRSSEDNILWTKERAKRLNPSEKLVSTHQELIPTTFLRPIITYDYFKSTIQSSEIIEFFTGFMARFKRINLLELEIPADFVRNQVVIPVFDFFKSVIDASEANEFWSKFISRLQSKASQISIHIEPTFFLKPIDAISNALDTGGRRILFAYPKIKEKQQFKIRVFSKLFYVDTLVIKSHLMLHHQIRIRSEIIPPDILTRSSEVKISCNINSIKVKSKQGLITWESEDESTG